MSNTVDIKKLIKEINSIPDEDIKRRRNSLEWLYGEIMSYADEQKRIDFTSCLLILAHHKFVNDNKSLGLEEYLKRRTRLQQVERDMKLEKVKGLLRTMYYRQQFLRTRAKKQILKIPTLTLQIPEIQLPGSRFTSVSLSPVRSLPRSPANSLASGGSSSRRGSINHWATIGSPTGMTAEDLSRNHSIETAGTAEGVIEALGGTAWGQAISHGGLSRSHSHVAPR